MFRYKPVVLYSEVFTRGVTVFCRLGAVEVLKTYQHEDTEDQFEREPFSVLFTDPRRGEGLVNIAFSNSKVMRTR